MLWVWGIFFLKLNPSHKRPIKPFQLASPDHTGAGRLSFDPSESLALIELRWRRSVQLIATIWLVYGERF